MAWELPLFKVPSLEAAADLSAHQFKFVKLDTNGRMAAITADTDKPYGVLQNKPDALGKVCEIMRAGISKVQGNADLSRGDQVGTSADGQAAAYVPGTDTTKYIVGEVLEDNSAAGGLATIDFNCAGAGRGS